MEQQQQLLGQQAAERDACDGLLGEQSQAQAKAAENKCRQEEDARQAAAQQAQSATVCELLYG